MFASKVTEEVTLEEGTVVIRKLNAKTLERAAEVRQAAVTATSRNLGPELFKALRAESVTAAAAAPVPAKPVPVTAESRYASFDRFTVLKGGIVSWSFEEEIASGVEDLDEEAANILSRRILDLSLPSLDPEAAQAARSKS